jgi:hypothetical protein
MHQILMGQSRVKAYEELSLLYPPSALISQAEAWHTLCLEAGLGSDYVAARRDFLFVLKDGAFQSLPT